MTRNTEGCYGEAHAALAHVTRSEILNYLKDKDYVRAGQIAEDLGIANSTLSGHLKVMKSAGLLVSRQLGTEVSTIALGSLSGPKNNTAMTAMTMISGKLMPNIFLS